MMKRAAYATLLAGACLQAAHAGPADYVYTPAVEYGEREIDFKLGTQKSGDTDRESAASLGFGWGLTPWWFTEVYAKYHHVQPQDTAFDAWEWENKFQLTETGKYFADLGLVVELERPRDRAEGYELRFGPLLQTEFGKLQLNGNLLFGRNYRAETSGSMEMGYQWQVKYRLREAFEFGLQGFGELGTWDAWAPSDEQGHRMGPAVFGKLALGDHQAIRYNAAWLFGTSPAAADNTFRMQVEYEF